MKIFSLFEGEKKKKPKPKLFQIVSKINNTFYQQPRQKLKAILPLMEVGSRKYEVGNEKQKIENWNWK